MNSWTNEDLILFVSKIKKFIQIFSKLECLIFKGLFILIFIFNL